MAISQVRALVNGSWYALTYNSDTSAYEVDITAPNTTSHFQDGGYYFVTVEAENDNAVITTATSENISGLRLYVRETVPPDLKLVSPGQGYLTNNKHPFTFTAIDLESGIDIQTLSLTVDGVSVYPSEISIYSITGGYQIIYTPSSALSDGKHDLIIDISDNDGNTSNLSLSYTVDTIPPTIDLFYPETNSVITDSYTASIIGKAVDSSGRPVFLTIENNEIPLGSVSPDERGNFKQEIALETGENNISVVAYDEAGLYSRTNRRIIRLVTDRTDEDVKSIEMLTEKINRGDASEEEEEEYRKSKARGSYSHIDVNRVTLAMEYIDEAFVQKGHTSVYIPIKGSEWSDTDYFLKIHADGYLENVKKLREVIPLKEKTPQAPLDMENFTFSEANDIEQILVDIDAVFQVLDKTYIYSGEAFAGEF